MAHDFSPRNAIHYRTPQLLGFTSRTPRASFSTHNFNRDVCISQEHDALAKRTISSESSAVEHRTILSRSRVAMLWPGK